MMANPPEPRAAHQRRYRVRGRVQGVGYRWWTRREAERLGITGRVRNLSDGSVEILARGTAEALTRFVALLRHGPEGAVVAAVEEAEAEAEEVADTTFSIER